MTGRVAAVDYGRRRIGLAVTDPLRITVRGLETVRLERAGDLEEAVTVVARRLGEAEVAHVVVGLPLHASGEESEMSREARQFGEALAERVGRPVELMDEGLTSWAAEESLKARGKSVREARRAGDVDREAAVALLRTWLGEQG